MADTIISNTPNASDEGSGAGWAVALVIIVAVIIGGVVLYQRGFLGADAPTTPSTPGTTNINVTVPDPTTTTPPVPTTPTN